MKYYCEKCGAVLTAGLKSKSGLLSPCIFCGNEELVLLPEYETPKQWEKRLGTKLPDNAPVWYRGFLLKDWKWSKWKEWKVGFYKDALQTFHSEREGLPLEIVLVAGTERPPDD